MQETKQRYEYFDGLRVVCAYLIVLLHVLARPLAHGISTRPMVWEVVNVMGAVTRIGVTVFFMISGALLLNSKKCSDIRYVLKDKVFNIFVKLFIVSLIYRLIYVFIIEKTSFSVTSFISAFLRDDIDNRLWFLYIIMGLYLCLPILRLIVESNKRNLLWYIVIIALLTNNFIYAFDKIFSIKIDFVAPMMVGYLGLFVLGYLINTTDLNKRQRSIIYILGIIGLLFRIIVTRELSHSKGEFVITFYNNMTFNVFLSSVALFVFAKYSDKFRKFSLINPVKKLSKISLGLYLVHPILVELFLYFTNWSGKRMGLHHIAFMFLVITIVSTIIALSLYQFKYTRKFIS